MTSGVNLQLKPATAAQVVKGITQESWKVDARVDRVYHYSMVGDTNFDSGLKDFQAANPLVGRNILTTFCQRPGAPSGTCQ